MSRQSGMRCPKCGAEMNHHADKVDYTAGHKQLLAVDDTLGGVLQQVHQCPSCGEVELRPTPRDEN